MVLARGSEKARSKWIISPVLTAVRRIQNRQISLFSGEDFSVDPALGLDGICDFLISLSPPQLEIKAPDVVIVEAKKENLNGGLGQCIAEMVAAQKFNLANSAPLPVVYGSVSSGTAWKFLTLEGQVVTIDLTEYPLPPVEQILSFLLWMVTSSRNHGSDRTSAGPLAGVGMKCYRRIQLMQEHSLTKHANEALQQQNPALQVQLAIAFPGEIVIKGYDKRCNLSLLSIGRKFKAAFDRRQA